MVCVSSCTPHVKLCTDAVFRPCKTNHFMNNQKKMDARKKKVSGHKMGSVSITKMRKTSGQDFSVCAWCWTDCISSWSRLWIPSHACSPQGVRCSYLQEGKMEIKLKLQPEWGSCDNSWTYFAIAFQRLCPFLLVLRRFNFGLGDLFFFLAVKISG